MGVVIVFCVIGDRGVFLYLSSHAHPPVSFLFQYMSLYIDLCVFADFVGLTIRAMLVCWCAGRLVVRR